MNNLSLNEYVKSKRKSLGLSREELALKAGVGLRFLRELEQGKETLKMDKVNQVLKLFGMQLGAMPMDRNNLIEPWNRLKFICIGILPGFLPMLDSNQ